MECRGWKTKAKDDDRPSEDNPGPGIWPEKGEEEEEFLDRCVEELTKCIGADAAEGACATKWEESETLGKKALRGHGRRMIMPIKPGKDEKQSEWMARCVPDLMGPNKDKRPNEQAVAACLDMWREDKGGTKPEKNVREVQRIIALWQKLLAVKFAEVVDDPDPDNETHAEFIDRCILQMLDVEPDMDEAEAEDACTLMWNESADEERRASGIVHKTHDTEVMGGEYVLSDATPDRYGDIVAVEGWSYASFSKNPIALFSHDPTFPIGTWQNIRIDRGALRGNLKLAPEGTSPRIDEIRKLVDAGILRAVSVGFKPIEMCPLKSEAAGFESFHYTKSELVETSLVSIPANPNALAVAKSLHISPETQRLVFGKHATKTNGERHGTSSASGKHAIAKRSGSNGKHADSSPPNRRTFSMSLSQRIMDVQNKIVAYSDELEAHLGKMNDDNVTDADLEKTNDLNAKIAQHEKVHTSLIEAEKRLAGRTANGGTNGGTNGSNGHLPAIVDQRTMGNPAVIKSRKKELDPIDYLVRAGNVAFQAKMWQQMPDTACLKVYGEDDAQRAFCDLVLRAASSPAMTTVPGWAQELAQQTYEALMPLLMPQSIFNRLSAKGLTLSFGRAGKIIIPTRSRTPTIAGSFVGEGNPIPVRQGAFTSQTLTPKKMAVISTWTREMGDHSTPAIEGLIREAIQEDTTVAMDSVLIDANPATVIRPAGLLNGVAALTATAGGGFTAIVGDLKQLIGALTANLYGNLRTPVWLANPTDMLSASLIVGPNSGQFPFKEEINAGSLNNIPIIDSSTVPAKTLILVDAADFVTVGGEGPRFDVSDQATLHEEDTTPAALVGAGSPGVVAAPQRSLFQTDSIALRMILPVNWVQRRPGTLAWIQNATWS